MAQAAPVASAASRASVLVCTRNRPVDLERLLRSLLADDSSDAEIIVVDQSDGDDSARVVEGLRSTERIRIVKSQTKGKGAAMNEGFALASTDIVVCTDDDCEAAPGWVGAMAAALLDHPRAALIFCRVKAPPHDGRVGYVPEYKPKGESLLRSAMRSASHRGLGAGMAVRRDAVLQLGGIDESFGPGARFGSGDDWDLEIRALLKGWEAFETDRISILHHGFRTFAEGRAHGARDWYALGAAAAKPVRAGHPLLVLMAARILVVDGLFSVARNLREYHRPTGTRRLVSFCRGFFDGVRTPVDRATLRYERAT